MKAFFYKRDIEKWRRKTSYMSLEQRGIYSELIDWYYCTGGYLPADLDELCRMVGATKRSERESVKRVMENPKLFSVDNSGDKPRLVQNMCDETLNSMTENRNRKVASAESRWNKNSNIVEMPHSVRNATHYSLPNNHESNPSNPVPTSARGGVLKKSGREGVSLRLDTLEEAKTILPRADIYAIEALWKASSKDMPKDPDRAFIGWCRHYAKNHPDLAA